MKKWQKTLVLILAVVMVVGLSSAALAASVTKKQLTAEYSGIQITLDGQKIEPKDANGATVEPFIVDGTTYLPVRALSNALGLDVDWDQATQTVKLSQKKITPEMAVTVYEDDRVKIAFIGCKDATSKYYWSTYDHYSEAEFYITNKTSTELSFSASTLSFNGLSYQFNGYEAVAPKSTGRVAFYNTTATLVIPHTATTSGKITIIDESKDIWDDMYSVEATWTNVVAK